MFDRSTNQGNLIALVDVYQRQAGAAFLAAKQVHDVAFSPVASIDDHVNALSAAGTALEAAQRALLAIHQGSTYRDHEEPFVPVMAGPIVLCQ